MATSFFIEVAASENFSIDEIWPDGDAPEEPTVDDVIERIQALKVSPSNLACDWGMVFEILVNGATVAA